MTTSTFRAHAARPLAALALCSTALCQPLAAQQLAVEDFVLSEVVVTASGFEQDLADAPASVSVITADELRRANVTNLSDALRGVPGVTTTGIAAEQDILIRGLPGQYTLILVDGRRQSTREARPNGSAGWEQSFIPPVQAIDRIEVVRGPMSSLYGSDAMGGVINIITKPVADVWTGSVTVEGTVPEGSGDGASRQASFYLAGPLAGDRLGLQVWGRNYGRQESGKLAGAPRARDRDLTARLTWMLTDTQTLALEGGTSTLQRNSSAGNVLEAEDTDSQQRNLRDHWSLTHKGQFGAWDTELSYSHERGQRTTWSAVDGAFVAGDREPIIENDVIEGKATTTFNLMGEHRFVGGFQHAAAKLIDQNPGVGTAVETFTSDQWALFAEDEWAISDTFALTLGARYTDHEQFGGHVTPRLYGVWNATPDLIVKGGVSTGYRTPDLRQNVPGYFYTTQQGRGVIVSNPDLKPEESLSYELGTQWTAGAVQLGATAFRTEFSDKIESFNTGETIEVNGVTRNRWEYTNIAEATVQGLELTGTVELSPTLVLQGGYTYTDSEQKTGAYAGLPLTRTPEHAASLRLDWVTPVDGLEAWTSAVYHGAEVNAGARIGTNGRPHAFDADGNAIAYKYDAYTTVDVGMVYAVNDRVTMNAAVYNLFDSETTADENNSVGEGRRLWLGVTTSF